MFLFSIITHVSQFQEKVIFEALASNERVCENTINLALHVQKLLMNFNKAECDKYLQQPRV